MTAAPTRQLVARRFDTAQPVTLSLAGAEIAEVWPGAENAQLSWVAPAFWDIQVNGYGGQEFSSADLTVEKVEAIFRQHLAFGVGRLCPTLTTQSFDVLAHGLGTIATACEELPLCNQLSAGIHLEGPYFSTEDGPRGAHPAAHCRQPDWDEFQRLQDAAGGRIVLLTMSPEFENAPKFIARAVRAGVVVALGHMGATAAQISAAVDAGATLSTHLGNGAHRMLPRHPNYIWQQMAEDRLWASLIVDGHHLPPDVVKCMVRAKTPARCVLVSDVSGLAGLPAGRYTGSGCDVDVLPDGRLVVAGQEQLLAGAALPIGVGVANVMRFAGVTLPEAIAMATTNPAAVVGARRPGLRPGDAADFVVFDLDERGLQVRQTWIGGRVEYDAASAP